MSGVGVVGGGREALEEEREAEGEGEVCTPNIVLVVVVGEMLGISMGGGMPPLLPMSRIRTTLAFSPDEGKGAREATEKTGDDRAIAEEGVVMVGAKAEAGV
jgi:hypothetical protein